MSAALLQWVVAVGAASQALTFTLLGFTFGTLVVFMVVLGALCLSPFVLIAAVYLFDMRKKDVTDV